MNFLIVVLLIVVICLLLILLYEKKINDRKDDSVENRNLVKMNNFSGIKNIEKDSYPDIKVEVVENLDFKDRKKLVEIKDKNLLLHINNMIPAFAKANLNVNNAVKLQEQGKEVLYKAILPAGEELCKSSKTEGRYRGMYKGKNGKFKGNAEFEKKGYDNKKDIVKNIESATMNIASMVVGQYYMSEIHKELKHIDKQISYVSNFLDKQYQSKVIAMITNTLVIADFTTDIMGNEDERNTKLHSIEDMLEKCSELLGHANLNLKEFKNKNNLTLAEYEAEMEEVKKWLVYQMMITETMRNLTNLKYVLSFSRVSMEQCSALLGMYLKDNEEAQKCLNSWHHDNMNNLGIYEHDWTIKRNGIDGAIHFLPGIFYSDLKYKELDPYIANLIKGQIRSVESDTTINKMDLYNKDVQLICKNGKIYYLPC